MPAMETTVVLVSFYNFTLCIPESLRVNEILGTVLLRARPNTSWPVRHTA